MLIKYSKKSHKIKNSKRTFLIYKKIKSTLVNFVKKENTSNEVLTILFSTIDYYLLVDSAFEFAIQFSLKECQQLTDFLLY